MTTPTPRTYGGCTLDLIEKAIHAGRCPTQDDVTLMVAAIRELEAENARLAAERDAMVPLRPKSEHPEMFEDGDRYLVGLRVNKSMYEPNRSGSPSGPFWECAIVRIRCDEGYFEVYECETQEPWGWAWDDVEVWAKLTPAAALEALNANTTKETANENR